MLSHLDYDRDKGKWSKRKMLKIVGNNKKGYACATNSRTILKDNVSLFLFHFSLHRLLLITKYLSSCSRVLSER